MQDKALLKSAIIQKDGLIEKNDRRSSEIFFKQDKFDYYLALLKNLKQHIEKK